MNPLFDSPEANELFLSILGYIDDLRSDLYKLQEAGEEVGELLDDVYELEEKILRKTE